MEAHPAICLLVSVFAFVFYKLTKIIDLKIQRRKYFLKIHGDVDLQIHIVVELILLPNAKIKEKLLVKIPSFTNFPSVSLGTLGNKRTPLSEDFFEIFPSEFMWVGGISTFPPPPIGQKINKKKFIEDECRLKPLFPSGHHISILTNMNCSRILHFSFTLPNMPFEFMIKSILKSQRCYTLHTLFYLKWWKWYCRTDFEGEELFWPDQEGSRAIVNHLNTGGKNSLHRWGRGPTQIHVRMKPNA